jgi:hypothetical protein
MKTSEWIETFLTSHAAAFGVHDWPKAGSEEYIDFVNMFIDAFLDNGVGRDEALRASRKLGQNPPKWGRDHLPAILAAVKGMRELTARADGAELTKESAVAASRNCGHCCGMGMTVVYLKASAPAPSPRTCAAHCVCAHGRWMRNQCRKQNADDLAKIPDLALVLTGNSAWADDEAFNGVADDEAAAVDFRSMFDSFRRSTGVSRA